MVRRRVCCQTFLVVALTASSPATARAYEADVDSSFTGQWYTLSSPYGEPLVRRRRYTQMLGLTLYDLQGDFVPGGPQLSFKSRMRIDADFGQSSSERNPGDDGRYVPGLRQAPLDLMYAYLEGRRYFGGWFGFRLGRQYVTDMLGWWSFDGGMVRLTTPAFFQVEAYGGFEQRGGLPMLSTSRFEGDGVYRGERSALESNQWPGYLSESKPAPAYGFAVESSGVQWLHGRLSYRKVMNRDTVVVSPFPDAQNRYTVVGGNRVSSEKLGYSARLEASALGSISGNFVYDLYNQVFSQYQGSLDWYATPRVDVGANYDYYLPTFDGDSIFNWFAHGGMQRAIVRTSWRIVPPLVVSAAGGVQLYSTDGNPDSYATAAATPGATPVQTGNALLLDTVARVGGSYRWSDGSLALASLLQTGQTGHQAGADITTKRRFLGGFYDTLVIVSLYDWRDALRPGRNATSFTYVLGGGVSPLRRMRFGVEWEHSMNRLVGQRFRALATLDVAVSR